MKQKFISWYSIFLGIGIMGFWTTILLSGSIPEGIIEMSFHLTSEFLMAILCLVSGVLLLKQLKIAGHLILIAHSMIIYSVLNAAGYYCQRNEILMVVMFIILLILSVFVIVAQLRIELKPL